MSNYTALISISSPSKKISDALFKAIYPDSEERKITPKGSVKVSLSGNTIVIEVFAKDLTGLRAIVNSYLRNLMAAKRCIDRLNTLKHSTATGEDF
ncbi:MAG: hypothetical protein DRN04_10015 [Thermoprotei archaeon]|nr:MAG: hypothetical protein DRN04_10015 [Thermoprotei archaeon]